TGPARIMSVPKLDSAPSPIRRRQEGGAGRHLITEICKGAEVLFRSRPLARLPHKLGIFTTPPRSIDRWLACVRSASRFRGPSHPPHASNDQALDAQVPCGRDPADGIVFACGRVFRLRGCLSPALFRSGLFADVQYFSGRVRRLFLLAAL